MIFEMKGAQKSKINLAKIGDVQNFVTLAANGPRDLFVTGEKDNMHIIRASSLLGLYSLDLAEPVVLVYDGAIAEHPTIKRILDLYGVKED